MRLSDVDPVVLRKLAEMLEAKCPEVVIRSALDLADRDAVMFNAGRASVVADIRSILKIQAKE